MWPFGAAVTIKSTQRGVLFRDGKLESILMPGRRWISSLGKRAELQVLEVLDPIYQADWLRALERSKPELAAKHFEIARPDKAQVVLVRYDKRLVQVVPPGGDVAFWKDLADVSTELLDVTDAPKIARTDITFLRSVASSYIAYAEIEPGHEGLVYIDGELREHLKPGVHAYWAAASRVVLKPVDLRRQATEVTAQEILTKDRVSVRVTLTAFWQVSDAVMASEAKDLPEQIYRHIQFAIRDAVAGRTLDELLNARGDIDGELTKAVQSQSAFSDMGVAVEMVGLKDVILPGEMREILNRVVEAEKQAQANSIRRQEETAATRSLLNTTRLMENNPLLLRMKELETLEKLIEKVGRLDVTTSTSGQGLDGLLNNLVSLSGKSRRDDD